MDQLRRTLRKSCTPLSYQQYPAWSFSIEADYRAKGFKAWGSSFQGLGFRVEDAGAYK